jgi:hypothetical protein
MVGVIVSQKDRVYFSEPYPELLHTNRDTTSGIEEQRLPAGLDQSAGTKAIDPWSG